MDLIFPHHENEIAQSCGATGKEFARYWVHNGFVQVNKEKMSKSLGNFFTIREIFEKSEWPEEITGEILRYFLLSTHYHGPLDFSDQALKEAKNALNGFYDLFKRLDEPEEKTAADEELREVIERCRVAFHSAMDDDLNTPEAIAAVQDMKGHVNKLLSQGVSTPARKTAREAFRSLGGNFGLFQLDTWQFGWIRVDSERDSSARNEIGFASTSLSDAEINRRVCERVDAKKAKDFKRADEIRGELKSIGIIIEDKPDGTTRWKR